MNDGPPRTHNAATGDGAGAPEPRAAPQRAHPIEAQMLGDAPCMHRLRQQLRRLARLRQPVLIRGETGTGKDLAAQLLHHFSPRRARPFVAINCAALPPDLAESELFGHEKGSFTGAHREHRGAFRSADGGTLFLDEIGDLSLAQQAKLLRTMETGFVRPVGNSREIRVDVRVVAATHRPLEAMVLAQTFREDLFHRVAVLLVDVPPLRQRPEDVPQLIGRFADEAGEELGTTVTFTTHAISAAQRHPWPGNVRALRNAVLRAAAFADGPIDATAFIPGADTPTGSTVTADMITVPQGSWSAMNRALLEHTVATHGSIRKAARALEVPRSTLGAWLRRDP